MITINVSIKDLDNIKKIIKIIDNKINEQGYITSYDALLLNTLLGKNWINEYNIGSKVLQRNEYK